MTAPVNEKLKSALYESYQEATCKNGLIDFARKVRGEKNDFSGKHSVSTTDLTNLFSEKVWVSEHKGGHRKLKNLLTGMVIDYANHGNDGGIDPGAALSIFRQVQVHLDFLCKNVFAYKTNHHWKEEPDLESSVRRLCTLKPSVLKI
jgi:hypothetical protein